MAHTEMTIGKMTYKDRLRKFNSTNKYIHELRFMNAILNPGIELILDYGCGTGTATKWIDGKNLCTVFGYDVKDLWDGDRQELYHSNLDDLINIRKAYFMHSLAHIENASEVIVDLKNRGVREVHIITPNLTWLDIQPVDNDYVPDDTVVKHYTSASLRYLFARYKVLNEGQFGEITGNQHERLFISVEL